MGRGGEGSGDVQGVAEWSGSKKERKSVRYVYICTISSYSISGGCWRNAVVIKFRDLLPIVQNSSVRYASAS